MNTVEVTNIDELSEMFSRQELNELPHYITVDGITYFKKSGESVDIDKIVTNHSKAYIVYRLKAGDTNLEPYKEKHAKEGFENCIVLLWRGEKLTLVPFKAMFVKDIAMIMTITKEDQTLQLEENITIHGINDDDPIVGKIDTGATMCSLHAEDIQVKNGMVEFTFNGSNYRMNIVDSVEIQNSETIEERPIVTFNVTVKGKTLNNVMFNLNDRSSMECELLVGQNLLKKGNFIIDPSLEQADDDKEAQSEIPTEPKEPEIEEPTDEQE